MQQIIVSDAEILRRTISAKARASAARAEKYKFKSRSAPPRGGVEELLSVELKSLAASKYEALESESSQWTDRMYSSLAAPMGSEIYLQAEQSAYLLGAPRFYHSELSTPHVDAQGRSIPPAPARFAYSEEAQMAAKKLQSNLARNYLRRQHAATVLQRVYLNFVCRKRARKARQARHEAASKIQRFCKRRQERTRRRQLRAEKNLRCCIRIQTLFRCALAKRRVVRRRKKRIYKAARVIQRFIAWIPRELRRRRGKAKRLHIHAVRIQSLFRGGSCRQRLKSSLHFWRLSLSGPFVAKMLRTMVPEYRRRDGSVKEQADLAPLEAEGSAAGDGEKEGQGDKDDDALSVNSSVTAASVGSKSIVVSVSLASAAANSATSVASAASRSGSVASTALTVSKFYVASTMRLTRRAYHRYLVHVYWHKRLISLPKESEWDAKCFLFGERIMRLLRLRVLRKKVARMQRLARKFLARRKFARKYLELTAFERSRVTSEQLLIERALTLEAADADCRWALGLGDKHALRERLPPNWLLNDEEEEAQTLMMALDLASASLLAARGSGDVRAVSLDASVNLARLPRRQIQSLAVLSAFSNRQLGRIDGNAVSVLRPFLRPTDKCLKMALAAAASDLAIKAKAKDRDRDRAKSRGPRATSASYIRLDRPLTLPDEQEEVAWSWLEHVPLCGILPLSSLLEPRPSLALRMTVTSRLPDQVLAAAALTRLWTRWTDDVIKRTIRRHRRQQGNKPKYCCPHCLESFALPRDEGQHLRSRASSSSNSSSSRLSPSASEVNSMDENEGEDEEEEGAGGARAAGGSVYGKRKMLCVRGRHMSWVGARAFLAPVKLLHLRVLNILSSSSAYPSLWSHSDVGAMMQGLTPLAKEQCKAMLAEARLILSRRHHRALARVEQRLSSTVKGVRFLPLVEDRRMAFCLEDELDLPHASDDEQEDEERSRGKSKGSTATTAQPTPTATTSSAAVDTDAAVAPEPEPTPKAVAINIPKSANKFLDPSTGGDVRRPPGPPPPGPPPGKR